MTMSTRCMAEELTVGFSSMSHGNDLDAFRGIMNQVQDPVVADTDAVGLLTVQFLNAKGSRVIFEGQELAGHPVTEGRVERIQLFLGGTLQNNLITHWGSRLARCER